MKKIGLFGGTFDPIHVGHIAVAMQVKTKFNLDKVIFIPSGQPPHKSQPEAPKIDRYEMVTLAVVNYKNFEYSDIEIQREGFSYAVDTVRHFKNNSDRNDKLFYITGVDIMETFLDWKDPYELMDLCEFIVVARPGYTFDNIKSGILEKVLKRYSSKIHLIKIEEADISATKIRKLRGQGRSIKGLVPEIIEEYINKKGLYSNLC